MHGGLSKRQEETLGDGWINAYVHYLNCGYSFTKYIKFYLLNIYSLS